MTLTLAQLGPAIRDYIEELSPAVVRELGVEVAGRARDTVRVKTGQHRASTTTSRSRPAPMDPGVATSHPPPTDGELRDPLRGLEHGERAYVNQGAPHAAPREALDHAVGLSIDWAEGDWRRIAEEGARSG